MGSHTPPELRGHGRRVCRLNFTIRLFSVKVAVARSFIGVILAAGSLAGSLLALAFARLAERAGQRRQTNGCCGRRNRALRKLALHLGAAGTAAHLRTHRTRSARATRHRILTAGPFDAHPGAGKEESHNNDSGE